MRRDRALGPEAAGRRRPFTDPDVAEVFSAYPDEIAQRLTTIRDLVFETAAELDGVGEVEEALRWGQPAYLTTESKSGSLIRIGLAKNPDDYGVFFHCGTNIVATIREIHPTLFRFDGNRALLFIRSEELPTEELKHCLGIALTYHLRKRS